MQYGEEASLQICHLALGEYAIVPPLPDGLSFNNGVILGNSSMPTRLRRYVVQNDTCVGSFWLAGGLLDSVLLCSD